MKIIHTGLPWEYGINGEANQYFLMKDGKWLMNFQQNGELMSATQEANAAFIVKACNSHDVLVAALRDATDALRIHAPKSWVLIQSAMILTKVGAA